jgi:hypothetical protein
MILTDLVERGRRSETSDMAADIGVSVGAKHHHHGVPTDIGPYFLLDSGVAGELNLLIDGYRIDVVGGRAKRYVGTRLSGYGDQFFN